MISDDQIKTRNIRTIFGPSTQVIRDTDDVLNIDTTAGVVNLTLQSIKGSGLDLNPRCIFINDIGNNSAVNAINVFSALGDLVNNSASISIQSNGANAKCAIANQTEWSIAGTGVSAAGITGMGTANRVPKFIATEIIGNSQIFDNGVSVGINTLTPDVSALVELASTDKGLLIPRMTTIQRNAIPTPGLSLMIFNLTTNCYEYFDGATWQIVARRDELQIYNPNLQYSLFQDFDKGVIPQGWTQLSSGAPATVNYTQAYEAGAIGQVQLNAPGPAALFASITYSSGYNYLLDFSDCIYTKWNSRFRRDPANVGVMLVGLANVGGSAVPTVFANVIALVHDPNNMTTANPTLSNNLFVWVKDASGQTRYDTGILPTNTWQKVDFEYNYSNPLAPYVNVWINDVLVVTVPGTDANLFVSQPAAANAGLKPVVYVGKTLAANGGNSLRCDSFNLIKKWAN